MTPTIAVVGIVIAAVGLGAEALGMMAVGSYQFRRRLPVKSPMDLVAFGGIFFAIGLVTYVLGNWLVR